MSLTIKLRDMSTTQVCGCVLGENQGPEDTDFNRLIEEDQQRMHEASAEHYLSDAEGNLKMELDPGVAVKGSTAIKWFKGEGAQNKMFENADARGHQCFVACDVSYGGKGTKEYASLPQHDDLAAELLHSFQNNKQPCCMYEILRHERPCKLYLDVEVCRPHEKDFATLNHLHDTLLAYVRVSHHALDGSVRICLA